MPITVIGLRSAGEWFDVLLPVLQGDDAYSRAYAAVELARLKEGRAIGPLLHALDDEQTAVRAYAAWALGELHAKRAVERLTSLLDEPPFSNNPVYHDIVAGAIATINNGPSVTLPKTEGVTKSPGGKTPRVHPDRNNRDELLKPIDRAINDVAADQNAGVAMQGELGLLEETNTLIEIATRALRREELQLQQAAIEVLQPIAGGQASALLREALQCEDVFIRCCAASALAQRGEAFPIEPFAKLDRIADRFHLRATLASLVELRDERSVPALIHALNYQDFPISDTTPTMREKVVAALIALTGEDFGYDMAMWEQWAAQRA